MPNHVHLILTATRPDGLGLAVGKLLCAAPISSMLVDAGRATFVGAGSRRSPFCSLSEEFLPRGGNNPYAIQFLDGYKDFRDSCGPGSDPWIRQVTFRFGGSGLA